MLGTLAQGRGCISGAYALHFAQPRLADKFHHVFSADDVTERDRRELESLAAGMKATANWNATTTVQTCRESCGGAATWPSTASPHRRPTVTSSPPSRAATWY
ncbi:MAG: acyl-CoA dehydrogenase family protein [Solirubrobacteraceae bacterium]